VLLKDLTIHKIFPDFTQVGNIYEDNRWENKSLPHIYNVDKVITINEHFMRSPGKKMHCAKSFSQHY
jgi:hypothetical protein